MRKKTIPIGSKIKNLTIISDSFVKRIKNNVSKRYIKVRCSCNKEYDLLMCFVDHPTKCTMCKSCASKINQAKRKNKYSKKTIGDLTGTYLNQIRCSAKQRNIEFNISVEYLWELFLKQDKRCALSNIEIFLTKERDKNKHTYPSKFTASLDRIDSNKGYIEGNVQWVHKAINLMKNTLTNEDFIYMCIKVSKNNHDNFEPSFENRDINFSRKVQRLIVEGTLPNNTNTRIHHPIVK